MKRLVMTRLERVLLEYLSAAAWHTALVRHALDSIAIDMYLDAVGVEYPRVQA